MKRKALLLAVLSLASLSVPAWAQNGTKVVPNEPEARAEDLQKLGKCPLAIPMFRALVNLGPGYELSQLRLGQCLLTVAKTEPDAAAAAAMKHEAADWIIKAANADLPNAQIEAVSVYLDGDGVDADPVEAAKWSLIYHANNARRIYGMKDVSPELLVRLDNLLNDQTWAKAHALANAWLPSGQGPMR